MPTCAMPKGLLFWAAKTAIAIVREPDREAELLEVLTRRCSVPVPSSPFGAWLSEATGEPLAGPDDRRRVVEALVCQMVEGLRQDPEAQEKLDQAATMALAELAAEAGQTWQ